MPGYRDAVADLSICERAVASRAPSATDGRAALCPVGRLSDAGMDARTEHLIALVKDGATLKDAGRVYGISGERVRQLLKEGGMNAEDLPGRAAKPIGGNLERARELAPVIEAMWREGMLYHEIAKVLDVSCEAVHRLIRDRVPQSERTEHTTRRSQDGRASDERLLHGMRKAAGVLSQPSTIEAAERRHAQAVIDGWLAAHAQLSAVSEATSRSDVARAAQLTSPAGDQLSRADLDAELQHFKARLGAGGLSRSTISAYLLGSSLFVRWLAGDYVPRGRRSVGPSEAAPELPS